jgi:hypothetical protein
MIRTIPFDLYVAFPQTWRTRSTSPSPLQRGLHELLNIVLNRGNEGGWLEAEVGYRCPPRFRVGIGTVPLVIQHSQQFFGPTGDQHNETALHIRRYNISFSL